jgi:RES domain-containing protein
MVEYLVHIPRTLLPKDLCIASIEVPEDAPSYSLKEKDLPAHWATYPPPIKLYEALEDLVRDNRFLIIRVPSAVGEGECNVLINPGQSGFKEVHIREIRDYPFDERIRSPS